MGSLSLPASGSVYVDTQCLIYSVEKHPDYDPLLRPLWQAVHAGAVEVISSELAVLETLVLPLKRGDLALQTAYEQLFQQPGVRLIPISQPILREAARIRAVVPGLYTPDALHAATALLKPCVLFLTNDTDFRRVPGLPLAVLKDALTP